MAELLSMLFAGASVVTACCALYLTIQSNKTAREQNEAAREHNRLSVKPRLTTTTMTNRNAYLDGTTRTLEFRVILTNVGLGPAVVKRAEVMLDGGEMPAETFEDVQPLLAQIAPRIQLSPSNSFFKLRREHAIEVGREVEIVAFEVLNPPPDLERELKRFSLCIQYESLYGEPLLYDSRHHMS